MKKLLVLLLLIFSFNSANSQNLNVEYKSYGGGYSIAVIQPTIENFILLLSLDENQFENEMKQYKYFEDNSGGKYRAFWNGSLDNFAYAKCVNTFNFNVMRNEIRFMVDAEMVYPENSITNLYRDLKPYYKDSKSDMDGNVVDYFAFKADGFVYSFFITNRVKLYDIMVLKENIQ